MKEGLSENPGDGRLDETTASHRDFCKGQIFFERFRLLEELGRGGMGVVFAAHDEVLGEEVALKFIHSFLVWQPGMLETLKEEVKQARRATHPNIVRVFEVHQTGGAVAISMERIVGPTLSALARHQPDRVLSPEDILSWLPGITGAIDYAHQSAKIVHRDIKPGNFLLHEDGTAKLADFGISRRIADWEEVRELFYDTGAAFADFIGLCQDTSAFVTRSGERQLLYPRQFVAFRNSGTYNPALLFHDHTAEAELLLGSWFNLEHPVLVRLTSTDEVASPFTSTRLVGERIDGGFWELTPAHDGGGKHRMEAEPGTSAQSSRFFLPQKHGFRTLRVEFNANLPPSQWGKDITLWLWRRDSAPPLAISIGHHPARQRSIQVEIGTEETVAHLRLLGARFGDFRFTVLARDEQIYVAAIPLRSPDFLFEEHAHIPGFRLADLYSLQWTLDCRDPYAEASWIEDIRLTALGAAAPLPPPEDKPGPTEP